YVEIEKKDIFREKLGIRPDQKIFLYQGGFTKGRGIEILLETFSQLQDDKKVLVCMGYGPMTAIIQEFATQHASIYFHEAVAPQVLLNYTASADYGISLIEDVCLS